MRREVTKVKVRCRKIALAQRAGFTLIELMIVVGIISILASVGIPYFIGYHEAGMTARCQTRLRALHTARQAYYAINPTKTSGAEWTNIYTLIGSATSNPASHGQMNENGKWRTLCPLNSAVYVWGTDLKDLGTPPVCPNESTKNSPRFRHRLDL